MPTQDGKLGVGVVGIGWCASEHIKAFTRNPHTKVVLLCGRDEGRVKANLEKYAVPDTGARITRRYDDLLKSKDVDIISITTPNDLHAAQAVAAARAGKHIVLEKPTGMNRKELVQIRDAVRRGRVRSIVSFELHYNPYLRFVHWLRESGRLGDILFARFQYLSRITDWYAGWNWVRTKKGGGSHLLAAGCHAVDALRWCSGLEPVEVSAYATHFTKGYEFPTTMTANMKLATKWGGRASAKHPVLAQVVTSTDFQLPYTFGVELMGTRGTVRDHLIIFKDEPIPLATLRRDNPYSDVALHEGVYGSGNPAVRIETIMPDTADVAHHPFQGEMDELVDCILQKRESHLNVHDAQKTMEVCLAADLSAERGGKAVKLPLI